MSHQPSFVPLRGFSPQDLLERLHSIRAAGDVPLVGDDSWPEPQWRQIADELMAQSCPPGVGWAALTSGSSGSPRIVLRTAASWELSYPALEGGLGIGPQDRVALPGPASSSLTLFSLGHWLAGGPIPLLAAGRTPRPGDFAEATCFHGTPQTFRALLEAGAPPKLRTALIGGSHLDSQLRQQAEHLGIRVIAYYGAAELSLVAIDTGQGLVPFPRVDIKVDDNELWVRSPYLAEGYLPGTGQAQAGPLIRSGSWATVGDRAEWNWDKRHGARRLRLLGRADSAILSASATIIPEEVEAVLRSVDGVADAVVFGLRRPRVGALVAAAVEPEGAAPPTAAALRCAADRLLAPTHRPRLWFCTVIPRTTSGKPARGILQDQAEARQVPRLA